MTSRVPVACEARKDDLAALALGEPLGDREPSLRGHLETCPGCRAYHAAMVRTLGAVRALPQPEPSEALTERILRAARRSQRATLLPASGLLARWLQELAAAFRRPLLASAVAAVAVASAAVALLVLGREESPAPPAGETGPRIARFEAQETEPSRPAAAPPPAAAPAVPAEGPKTPEAAPVPVAPETVALAMPAERPPAEEVSLERAQDEDRARENEEQGGIVAGGSARRGAGQAAEDRGTRTRAAPVAAPSPAEPDDAEAAAARFSPGREVGAGGGGDVVVGGQPQPVARDEAAWLLTDGAESTTEAQALATGTTTVPTLTGSLRSDTESGGSETRMPSAAPALEAPPASPPPPPSGAPATPSPVVLPGEAGYAGSASGGAESVALYGGAPPADVPAQDERARYLGFGADAVVAQETDRSESGAEPPADRVTAARRQLAEGDAAEAEAMLEQALREETARAADVTFLLAETYARQGKWSEAARTYELFLARYLDDPRADEARWRAADAYRRSGNTTRAAALLQQLLGTPGYDARARTALAELSAPAAGNVGSSAVDATAVEAAPAPAAAAPAGTP